MLSKLSCSRLVLFASVLFVSPLAASAAVTSVTVSISRPYENRASYTYAEITMTGTIARADGTTGHYSVPAIVIYPTGHANGVGVVDWINSAFYHFFPPSTEQGVFQFTLLSTGSYLFDEGYTYMSVQWNKAVTEIFGAAPPDDGRAHNPMVFGTIERSADAWEIFLDSARLLKNPAAFPGARPARVDTVIASGYSQGGALQLEMLVEGYDPQKIYDGHLIAMIGLACWKREDVAPHFGFLGSCRAVPSGNHAKVTMLVSQSDMQAASILGAGQSGYFARNAGDPNWREYEMTGVSHIPKPIVDLGAPNQNDADPRPIFRAAIDNLARWIRHNQQPPAPRYLDGSVDASGAFTPVVDGDGNWLGGLRLPHLESTTDGRVVGAPLGTYTGLNNAGLNPFNVFLFLGGTFERFNDEEILARYPTRDVYVRRVSHAANALAAAGYILNVDRKAITDAAEALSTQIASDAEPLRVRLAAVRGDVREP